MSRKKDISREEIVKQFLLPERQSKIDTVLKLDGQAYCICRSSDSSRFMIACDACEEWYHGDCVNISEKESKMIKQYICVRCNDEDPTLRTRWKTKRDEIGGSTATTTSTNNFDVNQEYQQQEQQQQQRKYRKRKERGENKNEKKLKRCGDCMGCYRTEDCGRCDICIKRYKYGTVTTQTTRLKDRCKQRICVNYGGNSGSSRRKRRDSSSDHELPSNIHLMTDYPRQCYGPTCINSARYGSKYCSDECGLKLATNRILQVLPQRLQEWSLSPCLAEELNIKQLDIIRKQQIEVKQILHELDKRHNELDLIIERAKNATIDPNWDNDNKDDDINEISTYCITCGHEIHSKTAIKHMDKCFNKYESQATFGSIFKTRIEGNNMFCDFYNSTTHTYCKRLRVLCPEHSKDPKIHDNIVCGCPIVTNVFNLTGEFCRAPKKYCIKHYVWEKLRRAEIDLERVRQWLKLDELLEKERQLRSSMANRAGVLALMLHSTYNHEVMEQITKASQQDQQAMQQELTKRFRTNTTTTTTKSKLS